MLPATDFFPFISTRDFSNNISQQFACWGVGVGNYAIYVQCEAVRISYLKIWAWKEYFIAILYSHADEDSYFIASHSNAAVQYSFLVT